MKTSGNTPLSRSINRMCRRHRKPITLTLLSGGGLTQIVVLAALLLSRFNEAADAWWQGYPAETYEALLAASVLGGMAVWAGVMTGVMTGLLRAPHLKPADEDQEGGT